MRNTKLKEDMMDLTSNTMKRGGGNERAYLYATGLREEIDRICGMSNKTRYI